MDQADSAPASAPGWTDLASSFTGITLDTEIFVETTGSIGNYCTTTRDGTFYEFSADTDLSNNHIYIWVNCGIVGLLETKENQGLTFRARGPTTSNYKEWDLAGSNNWPTTVEGGWAMFVIDLESTVSRNGGTPPATSAIRSIGITYITATTMPRMADNIWVDEIRRLPDGSAGITVEGRNTTVSPIRDWNWSDLPVQLGAANGTAKVGPAGAVVLNTPVEFFADDASTHAFASTNETVLWENQEFAASDLYSITVLGASTGTANWSMGAKTGTGVNASGAQGGAIIAESTGVRWDFDADIANIDSCNLYGVTCQHGGDFQLDTATNEVVSSLFVDTTTVEASNSNLFIGNSYIGSSTAADAGALVWNENVDVDGIIDGSTFEKGTNDHHAITFGTSVTTNQTIRDCAFNSFAAPASPVPNGAAFQFLATSGSLTLSLVNCTVDGSAATSANIAIDDAAGVAVTLSIDPVTIQVNTVLTDGSAVASVYVHLIAAQSSPEGPLPVNDTVTITRAGSPVTATVSHTGHGFAVNQKVLIKGATEWQYNGVKTILTVPDANSYTYALGTDPGGNATGTITATAVILDGLTNGSGVISATRELGGDQLVTGWARKSTSAPYYQQASLNGTISSTSGLTLTATMISDE